MNKENITRITHEENTLPKGQTAPKRPLARPKTEFHTAPSSSDAQPLTDEELELLLGTRAVKTMHYKGFLAQVMFYADDNEFIGAVTNAHPEHPVYFSGKTVFELKANLHQAVDQYLAKCEELGIEPDYVPKEGKIVPVSSGEIKEDTETDWERFDQMTDREVTLDALSDPDAPPLTDEELKRMKPVRWRGGKRVEQEFIRFHIDKDVLKWFTRFGDDYQTRMNDVLRDYIEAYR
ncbi:MAG: BrnA antitoxin family protein [Candidatus Poribacteria bacterium]|nr:BrnA antitoxin family protein [Candidatus Poribacteria bacterium]